MGSNESHDSDKYHLTSGTVTGAVHSHGETRHLKKEEEEAKSEALRGTSRRLSDDDDYWWDYTVNYATQASGACSKCGGRRLLSEWDGKDDDESHSKWEESLCSILGQTEIFVTVTDCKIEFV